MKYHRGGARTAGALSCGPNMRPSEIKAHFACRNRAKRGSKSRYDRKFKKPATKIQSAVRGFLKRRPRKAAAPVRKSTRARKPRRMLVRGEGHCR